MFLLDKMSPHEIPFRNVISYYKKMKVKLHHTRVVFLSLIIYLLDIRHLYFFPRMLLFFFFLFDLDCTLNFFFIKSAIFLWAFSNNEVFFVSRKVWMPGTGTRPLPPEPWNAPGAHMKDLSIIFYIKGRESLESQDRCDLVTWRRSLPGP